VRERERERESARDNNWLGREEDEVFERLFLQSSRKYRYVVIHDAMLRQIRIVEQKHHQFEYD